MDPNLFKLFNQEAIKDFPKQMEALKAENKRLQYKAEQMIKHLDGMSLHEVDKVLMALRDMVKANCVVKVDK